MELFQQVSAVTTRWFRGKHKAQNADLLNKWRGGEETDMSTHCFVRDLWVLNTLTIALYAHSPAPRHPVTQPGVIP